MFVTTRLVKQKKSNAKDWPAEYTCNFLTPGLVSYQDVGAGIANLPKETILKMLQSFVGKPVVIDHIDVSPKTFEDHAVGYITRVWYDDYANWAMCSFLLTDDKAKEAVAKGYSVSCAYDGVVTGPGGEKNAIKYDETILDGVGNHLALVTSPRYEEAKIQPCLMLVNSKKGIIKAIKENSTEGRKYIVNLKWEETGKTNKKEGSTMSIKLFKKANDKAGSEVDPKDPTKQKWNAESVYVQIENEMVPLSELAKCADVKENEYVALPEAVENELDINGAVHNVSDLIEKYKANKAADKKNEDKKDDDKDKKDEDKDKKENEDKDKKDEGEDKEKKENADDKDKKDNDDEEEEAEEQIKKNNKSDKKDVKHFLNLNTARENGSTQSVLTIDTMHNRVDRGVERYGSAQKAK